MKQRYTFITLVCLFSAFCFSSISAQVFWSEDFSGGLPNDWVAEGPDSEYWKFCDNPLECAPNVYGPVDVDLIHGTFKSPSAGNGYVFYDSFSDPNGHKAVLRTPEIDISDQDKVFIEFFTHITTDIKDAEAHALLQIVTPNDTISLRVFPGLWEMKSRSTNDYRVNYDLSPFLQGVNTIVIQWYWDGIHEFSWSIDDIQLSNEDLTLPPGTCWSERFAFGMDGWTTTNTAEPDALWEWIQGGDAGIAAFANTGTVIQSPTGVDGAVSFNGDFLSSGGSKEELQANENHYYRSELISPVIDLSCSTRPLELHFSQLVKKGNPSTNAPLSDQQELLLCSISWTADGGENWSTPIDASPQVTTNFQFNVHEQQRVVLPLPAELIGASNVQLRFTWAGNLFFWVIDDIAISERLPFDMQVNRNFFAVMPNAMTPYGQIGAASFLADLTNLGYQDATGVNLDLSIAHMGTGETVYSDQLLFPTVASNELIENVFFEDQFTDQQITRTGSYKGRYTVTQDSLDMRPQNDTINWSFEISDSTFAKELGPTRNITSSETLNFTYGNCFFVPNGNGKFARWITVGIANINALSNTDAEISTFFYKWVDANNNNLAEPDEYEFVENNRGFNSYQFESMEDDFGFITLPIHFEGDGIPLEDSTYYLVAVQYIASDNVRCNFLASESINYQATAFISDSLQQNRYSSILDLNNTGTFDFIGFGLDVVPVVRLHIGDVPELDVPGVIISNDSDQKLLANAQVEIAPNPNQGQFNVKLDLQNLSKYVGISVLNMSGSILFSEKFENIKQKQFNLSFSTIPAGIYLMRIQTDEQVLSRKFVVVQQ